MISKVKTRFWDVASCTYGQLLEQLEAWRREGARGKCACFCDAMGLAKGWRMEELRRAYRQADLVLADGGATKALAKISGGNLPERVIGPYLFPKALEYGVSRGWRHFFYGGAEGVAEELKRRMEARFPGVKIVGTCSPEYAPDPAPPAACVKRPSERGADAVPACDFFWVGLGNPKQELWCAKHAAEIDACCLMPVGAVFDFYTGRVPQTPDWVHAIGCCWLWRLMTGGRHALKRDLWCVPRAAWTLVTEFVRIRLFRRAV